MEKEKNKMNNKRLFLDIHVIQTVPSSNINRDDTGSPKTAQYGGVTRSRVSSQSWKKAVRDYFKDNSEEADVGVRSLEIVRYIAEKIKGLSTGISDEEAMKKANDSLNNAGVKTKDQKARALFFISSKQADHLAQLIIEGETDKKEYKKQLRNNPAIDIALFGRMVADDPSLNTDASAQVSHALSTHAVETEFDFYTATDDFSSREDAGAGMLGTVEFNSSTLYRYANVAVHDFNQQLLEDSEKVVNSLALFLEAFVKSMPTGKSNTFANQTLPQAILISLRDDRPVNLVSAFESPIQSTKGYVKNSIEKLVKEHEEIQKWVNEPLYTKTLGIDESLEETNNFNDLLDDFKSNLKKYLTDKEG